MHYHDDSQQDMFAHLQLEEKVRDLPLNPLSKLSHWVDFEFFRPTIEHALGYSRTKSVLKQNGRPPYDVVMMFKILVLQSFYNISDDQVEYQINDRISFRQFLGLTSSSRIPDAKTVWLFRDKLQSKGIIKNLFVQMNQDLVRRGVIVNEGQLIDASFVEVPRQRNSREENTQIKEEGTAPEEWENPNKIRQKDVDARWTQKNKVNYYGYKNHVSVDRKSKLVTNWELTHAAVHDSQPVDDLLKPWAKYLLGQGLWADSAYSGPAVEEICRRYGIDPHIHEKGARDHPLTEEQKDSNRIKSSQRVRVEHIFGFMTNAMNQMTARGRSLKRNKAVMGVKNLTYNLCRLTQLKTKLAPGMA